MSKMNKFTKYVMAPALVAALSLQVIVPSSVHAADPAAVAVLPHGQNSSFLSNLEAGSYDFSKIDKTAVQNFLNSEHFRQNERDLKMANKLLNEFDREFMKFLRYNLEGSLGGLKAKALTGQPMQIGQIVQIANDFKAAKLALETKINAVEAMIAGLPGPARAAGGQDIPAPNRFDVSGLANVFRDAIVEGVKSFGGDTEIRITFREGRVGACPATERIERSYSIADAINLNFEGLPSLICDAELTNMEQQAKTHMKVNDEEREAFQDFALYALQERIKPYLRECGQEQRWRPTSGQETSWCEQQYRAIYEIMMVRHYVRKFYGVGIGVFGVQDYEEKTFGWDRLSTTTDVVGNFVTGSIYFAGDSSPLGGEGAIARAEKSYRQYMDVARERASDLGFSEDIVSNINTIIRMTQDWTKDLALVNMQILNLLAADTYAELTIIRDNHGQAQRDNYYDSRYFADALSDDQYNANVTFEEGFSSLIGAASGTSGILNGGFGETSGGIRAEISAIETALNSLIDRFATARDIFAQVQLERAKGQRGTVRDELRDRQPPKRQRR